MELTLADCLRYVRQLGGIDHAAQILKDLASQARPDRLSDLAPWLENTTIRRLGYLLEALGFSQLAEVLLPFATASRNWIPLSSQELEPLWAETTPAIPRDTTWKLLVNHTLELDD